jgi:hypothetical protein
MHAAEASRAGLGTAPACFDTVDVFAASGPPAELVASMIDAHVLRRAPAMKTETMKKDPASSRVFRGCCVVSYV